MRTPGFYWVKDCIKGWQIAIWRIKYDMISSELKYDSKEDFRWFIAGVENGFNDEDLDEIDERRIIREREDIPLKDQKLTVSYLLDLHPELTYELAVDLLNFSIKETISLKGCYGDGRIIYPLWKAQLPK